MLLTMSQYSTRRTNENKDLFLLMIYPSTHLRNRWLYVLSIPPTSTISRTGKDISFSCHFTEPYCDHMLYQSLALYILKAENDGELTLLLSQLDRTLFVHTFLVYVTKENCSRVGSKSSSNMSPGYVKYRFNYTWNYVNNCSYHLYHISNSHLNTHI